MKNLTFQNSKKLTFDFSNNIKKLTTIKLKKVDKKNCF